MKSKYEIVLQETTNVIFNEHDLLFTGLSKAMDEYAAQESLEFLAYITDNYIQSGEYWKERHGNLRMGSGTVYNKFLKHKEYLKSKTITNE